MLARLIAKEFAVVSAGPRMSSTSALFAAWRVSADAYPSTPSWRCRPRPHRLPPAHASAREAEHPLGDDVALDLARAAGDRRRRTSAGTGSPTMPSRHICGPRRSRSSASAPSASAPKSSACCSASLPNSLSSECSGDDLPVQELREAAVAHREQRLRVDVEAGDRVAEARVVAEAAAVGRRRVAERDERVAPRAARRTRSRSTASPARARANPA